MKRKPKELTKEEKEKIYKTIEQINQATDYLCLVQYYSSLKNN